MERFKIGSHNLFINTTYQGHIEVIVKQKNKV